MDRNHSSSNKTERKIVEKNRRNHMKNLYSNLTSLLPPHFSKEALSLPDQIDASVAYIKSLEAELQSLKERKQRLTKMGKKKRCVNSETTLNSPKMEIHEMGSCLKVVLVSGIDDHFIFSNIARMFHEEGADVVNASFSVSGNSIFHTFHAQVGECMFGFGASRVTERLRRYVNGSNSEGEMPLDTWDFQIDPDSWDQF